MSKGRWDNLARTEEERWDKFAPLCTSIILGITKPPPTTTLNLHDMSAAEYLHLVNITKQQLVDDTLIERDKNVGNNRKASEASDDGRDPETEFAGGGPLLSRQLRQRRRLNLFIPISFVCCDSCKSGPGGGARDEQYTVFAKTK